MKFKTFILSIFIFLQLTNLQAQTGFSSLGGANYLGLARAGVAQAGASSIYLNQAGMTTVNNMAFDVSLERRFNLEELTQVSLSAIKSFKIGTLGVMASSFGFDQYSEQKLALAYARKLTGALSIGGQFDMLRYNIENVGSKNVFSLELGMMLNINEHLALGVHMFSPVHVRINENEEITTRFRTGFKYMPSKKVFLLAEADKSIDKDIELKFGIGYEPINILTLMTGFNTTLSTFHFGATISFNDKYRISTALATSHILGNTPAISLQYQN